MIRTFPLFFTCLEVVDRLDNLVYLDGIANIVNDIVQRLVCHGALIERSGVYRGRVDTVHLLLELRNSEALLCLRARHKTSSTVRSRTVPVRVDSEKAANNLITIANAYDMEAEAIENVVDKVLSLDVASQTEGGALSTAVARTAKNAQLAGVTLDSLAAQIANLRDVTGKEEEQIATSLNSIYSRMYNVKLGKFVIEDESGVDDITEDISDMEKILNKVDIKLRDSKGTFRDFDDIIKDLHDNWNKFNEVEKSAIGKTIGGTYHRNVALAMIQDYNDFQRLQEISLNSAGTAAERYEAYTDSIAAKSAELNTALKQMWSNTVSGELVTDVKGATAEVVQFIDKYEILQNLLKSAVIYGAAKGFVYLGGTIKDAYTSIASMSQAFKMLSTLNSSTAGTADYQNALSSLITYSKGLSDSQLKLLFSTKQLTEAQMMEVLQVRGLNQQEAAAMLSTMGLTTAEGSATTATLSLSGAFQTLSAAIAANPIGAAATAIMGIFSLYSIIERKSEEAKQAEKALQEQTEQNISKYQAEASSLDDVIDKYTELVSNTEDVAQIRKSLSDMQEQIISNYGSEAQSIDLVNGKYSEQIERLYELKRARADVFINDQDNIDAYNKALEVLNNSGNINGKVDVEVAYKGGISQDILDKWKAENLIADSVQYTMSSKDYGFNIEGAENAETLYKTLEKMAESYKELSTASGDFNESQYTALKQQAIAAKDAYDKAKEVTDFFEKSKAVAEFELSADSKKNFDELLDKAEELNQILTGDSSAVVKDSAADELKAIQQEINNLAAESPELKQTVESVFKPLSEYLSQSTGSVSNVSVNWKSTLTDMEKNTLDSVTKINNALQALAEGNGIEHKEAWEIIDLDTNRILEPLIMDSDNKYVFAFQRLIALKDEIINKQIEQIENEKTLASEGVKNTTKAIQNYEKMLSAVSSETDAQRYKALIAEGEERLESYGDIISKDNLLIQELNGSLGDTTNLTKAFETKSKAIQKEVETIKNDIKAIESERDSYLEAQKSKIDSVINGFETEKEILEDSKKELQEQLETLNEQKSELEDIIKNYSKVPSIVNEALQNEISSIEDSYNNQIEALKAQNEEREEAINLTEKLNNLNNAKNNKVVTYTEAGGFQYGVNKEALNKAQSDYDKALIDSQISKLEQERDESTKSLKEYAKKWEAVSSAFSDAENEQIAVELLGADWREKIKEQDSEILNKYKEDYSEYNDKLNQLVNIEIANLNESIKAKDIEIKAKQAQIDIWKKYKNQVISIADSIKNSLSDYSKFLDDVNINENSTYQERMKNLNTFAAKYSDFIDRIADKNIELENATSRVNDLSDAMEQIGGIDLTSINDSMEESLSFIEKYADAIKAIQKRLEESSTGYGIVNSEWDAKLIRAASSENFLRINDVGEKLYSSFRNDSSIAEKSVESAISNISNIKNISSNINNHNSSNAVNVDIHVGQIVSDNPQQFAKQMENYLQKTITESQIFPPRK